MGLRNIESMVDIDYVQLALAVIIFTEVRYFFGDEFSGLILKAACGVRCGQPHNCWSCSCRTCGRRREVLEERYEGFTAEPS